MGARRTARAILQQWGQELHAGRMMGHVTSGTAGPAKAGGASLLGSLHSSTQAACSSNTSTTSALGSSASRGTSLWVAIRSQLLGGAGRGSGPGPLLPCSSASSAPGSRLAWGQQAGKGWRTAWTDSQGYTHFDSGNGRAGGGWRHPSRMAVLAVGAAGAGLYYWSSIETVPFTNRRHAIMFVSKARERAMGKAVFDMQCQEAQMMGALLPQNHPYTQTVKHIGSRIAKVATSGQGGGNHEHMQNMDWEYAVIKSQIPNAFVVPGGKVVVFTGLIDMLTSQDELAAVMAHETAHVLARHHAERISTLNTFGILKFLVYWAFGFGLPDSAMYLGIFLPYSRRAEHEADTIGLRLMSAACYDPGAAPTMLAKLHAKERSLESRAGAVVPAFLRTHPLTEERVQRVEKELPEAYKIYEASGCAGVQSFLKGFL